MKKSIIISMVILSAIFLISCGGIQPGTSKVFKEWAQGTWYTAGEGTDPFHIVMITESEITVDGRAFFDVVDTADKKGNFDVSTSNAKKNITIKYVPHTTHTVGTETYTTGRKYSFTITLGAKMKARDTNGMIKADAVATDASDRIKISESTMKALIPEIKGEYGLAKELGEEQKAEFTAIASFTMPSTMHMVLYDANTKKMNHSDSAHIGSIDATTLTLDKSIGGLSPQTSGLFTGATHFRKTDNSTDVVYVFYKINTEFTDIARVGYLQIGKDFTGKIGALADSAVNVAFIYEKWVAPTATTTTNATMGSGNVFKELKDTFGDKWTTTDKLPNEDNGIDLEFTANNTKPYEPGTTNDADPAVLNKIKKGTAGAGNADSIAITVATDGVVTYTIQDNAATPADTATMKLDPALGTIQLTIGTDTATLTRVM